MRLSQKIIEKLNISGKLSQSYYGEDILLWRYFKNKGIRNGYFIDIGAYHPKFFNNTWRLRKKLGFRGINIEPTNRINLFKIFRRDDINLQCAIGNETKSVELYYVSEEPAVSGKDQSKMVKQADKTLIVEQYTLTDIVSAYNVQEIDLLDIDIEGTEMEALHGYDWSVMPRLILIEDDKDKKNKIAQFLLNKGYYRIAHTLNNALYEL